MRQPREIRIAVGDPNGKRSSVWKIWVEKNAAYILTRMFGADAKVSFHSSGRCQWSATDRWVADQPGRRNADRQFVRWQAPHPLAAVATHMFRVLIPRSELRASNDPEDLASVEWLSPPPPGKAIGLEVYVTPKSHIDPGKAAALVDPPLLSARLADGRWLVVLAQVVTLKGVDLAGHRARLVETAVDRGINPTQQHRACALFGTADDARGLLELCLLQN